MGRSIFAGLTVVALVLIVGVGCLSGFTTDAGPPAGVVHCDALVYGSARHFKSGPEATACNDAARTRGETTGLIAAGAAAAGLFLTYASRPRH
jgi:hypothetical protein